MIWYVLILSIGIACVLISLLFIRLVTGQLPRCARSLGLTFFWLLLSLIIAIKFHPHYQAWQFERRMSNISLYALIKQQHPQTYNAFMQQAKADIIAERPATMINKRLTQLVDRTFAQYIKLAPNEAIYQFIGAQLQFYQYLAGIDTKWIVDAETGHLPMANQALKQPQARQLMLNILERKKEVIDQGSLDPQPPVHRLDVYRDLEPIFDNLSKTYGQKNFALYVQGHFNELPAEVASKMILSFYQQLYRKGPRTTGAVIRYMTNH